MRKLKNTRDSIGELGGGLEVKLTEDGKFEARTKGGAIVGTAETYKGLVAEVRRVQREADRDEFGKPEVLILEAGKYRDEASKLYAGTLLGLSPGNRLKVKTGGKTKTFTESFHLLKYEADTEKELRAAVDRVTKIRAQLAEAEQVLKDLEDAGVEFTPWHMENTARDAIVAEIKEALA